MPLSKEEQALYKSVAKRFQYRNPVDTEGAMSIIMKRFDNLTYMHNELLIGSREDITKYQSIHIKERSITYIPIIFKKEFIAKSKSFLKKGNDESLEFISLENHFDITIDKVIILNFDFDENTKNFVENIVRHNTATGKFSSDTLKYFIDEIEIECVKVE